MLLSSFTLSSPSFTFGDDTIYLAQAGDTLISSCLSMIAELTTTVSEKILP
jgi:hypothetical protein